MVELIGTVTRWVGTDFRGWVEVQVLTVDGMVTVVDKVSVLTKFDTIEQTTIFPVEISVECQVTGRVRDEHNRDVVIVMLSHGVADAGDNSILRVFADQVIEDRR